MFNNLESHLVAAAHAVLEIVPLLQAKLCTLHCDLHMSNNLNNLLVFFTFYFICPQNVSVEYVPQVGYLVAVQEREVHFLQHTLPPIHSTSPTRSTSVPAYSSPSNQRQQQQRQQSSQFSNWEVGLEDEQGGDSGVFEDDGEGAGIPVVTQSDHFSFVYKQAGVHYFKHRIVEELDSSIGDIKSEIADRQRFLILQLEDVLLSVEEVLQQLCITVSTLDALFALGSLAVEQKLCQPEITEDVGVIMIKNGRHLLQELTVDNFIPNDTFISREKNIALITGPNTSGKSVYLKQVALIVYLAHIGSFVPCERARISLTDRILTRISSTETVSAPQSAFALDLQQMSRMLRLHTSRSLCLVDEFGKGTMPVDGIALLAATVKHFAAAHHKGAAMFVLHFTEILHDQILSEEVMRSVSCFRMETLSTTNAAASVNNSSGGSGHVENSSFRSDFDGGTPLRSSRVSESQQSPHQHPLHLQQQQHQQQYETKTVEERETERTPLFKLKRGVARSSEGIPCAASAGVDEAILRRAAEVKHSVTNHQSIQVNRAQSNSLLENQKHVQLLCMFLQSKQWIGDAGAQRLSHFQDLL